MSGRKTDQTYATAINPTTLTVATATFHIGTPTGLRYTRRCALRGITRGDLARFRPHGQSKLATAALDFCAGASVNNNDLLVDGVSRPLYRSYLARSGSRDSTRLAPARRFGQPCRFIGSKRRRYSITSSAPAISIGGASRPTALAVIRFNPRPASYLSSGVTPPWAWEP